MMQMRIEGGRDEYLCRVFKSDDGETGSRSVKNLRELCLPETADRICAMVEDIFCLFLDADSKAECYSGGKSTFHLSHLCLCRYLFD